MLACSQSICCGVEGIFCANVPRTVNGHLGIGCTGMIRGRTAMGSRAYSLGGVANAQCPFCSMIPVSGSCTVFWYRGWHPT